jgi:hypothetical protein
VGIGTLGAKLVFAPNTVMPSTRVFDVSGAARARARVLRGTVAAQWSVGLVVLIVLWGTAGYTPRDRWLRYPMLALLLACIWAAVRFCGRMRRGDRHATRLAVAAVAALTLIAAAVPVGANSLSPLMFARGFFEGGADWLPGLVDAPWLSVFAVVPLGLALDASALGEWLRERSALRRDVLRLALLFGATWAAVWALLKVLASVFAAGLPVWALSAIVITTALAFLVVIGAKEILGSRRFSPPYPWEPASPARPRRLFTGRQPARVLLLLSGSVVLTVLGLSLRRVPPPDTGSGQVEAARFIAITEVIGWSLLIGAVALYLRARRRAALRAAEVLTADARAPILYLRSFDDDKLRVWAHGSPRRSLVERMLGRRKERFEVVLGWHLWGVGPVTAVGRPSERLPPLGAAREYLGEDHWQSEVEERIEEAQEAITLVLGRTIGLVWELQAIKRLGAADRLLLIIPPVDHDEEDQRWETFEHAASQMGWPIPEPAVRSRMLAGTLDRESSWLVVTGRRRDEYHYEVAIEAGLGLRAAGVAGTENARQPGSSQSA